MARLVLVHGAWGSAAAWGSLPDLLGAAGHEVQALDLPGHGDDPTPPYQVSLNDYRDAVIARLAGRPAVLVGHSMGGMVISAVAEAAPELVQQLIYVCAFVPGDGDSLLSLMKRQPLTIGRAVQRGDGATTLDPQIAAGYLFQDADSAARQRALAELGVQPNRPQTDPVSLGAAFAGVPKHYIHCQDDHTITPELQARMAQGLPNSSLACGHFPQLTAIEPLAQHISSALSA